jgi:hypothetical protein
LWLGFLPDLERLAYFRGRIVELDALKAAIDARQEEAIHDRMHAFTSGVTSAISSASSRSG